MNLRDTAHESITFPPSYLPRDGDLLFARVLIERAGNGVRVGLISGPPGVGKTALAAALADSMQAEHVYFLAHHWVSEEDLFIKLDPARVAALAGGVDGVQMVDAYRPGALLRAVEASQRGPVVLTLDEWDKAPERADALLLDFLQTGYVRGPFGEEWQARTERLYVILTTNNVRPLSEPLQRRCYRYEMQYLPAHVEADILRKRTGAKPGVIRLVVKMLEVIRSHGDSSPSLQEAQRLLEALPLAQNADDVCLLVAGHLCKTERDEQELEARLPKWAASLWGEMQR